MTISLTLILCVASCLPWVPEQGTVGASGDLAPMSHLALGMMGEGMMWSPESGWADAKYVSCVVAFDWIEMRCGSVFQILISTFSFHRPIIFLYTMLVINSNLQLFQVLEAHGLTPIKLGPKEVWIAYHGYYMPYLKSRIDINFEHYFMH